MPISDLSDIKNAEKLRILGQKELYSRQFSVVGMSRTRRRYGPASIAWEQIDMINLKRL